MSCDNCCMKWLTVSLLNMVPPNCLMPHWICSGPVRKELILQPQICQHFSNAQAVSISSNSNVWSNIPRNIPNSPYSRKLLESKRKL